MSQLIVGELSLEETKRCWRTACERSRRPSRRSRWGAGPVRRLGKLFLPVRWLDRLSFGKLVGPRILDRRVGNSERGNRVRRNDPGSRTRSRAGPWADRVGCHYRNSFAMIAQPVRLVIVPARGWLACGPSSPLKIDIAGRHALPGARVDIDGRKLHAVLSHFSQDHVRAVIAIDGLRPADSKIDRVPAAPTCQL